MSPDEHDAAMLRADLRPPPPALLPLRTDAIPGVWYSNGEVVTVQLLPAEEIKEAA